MVVWGIKFENHGEGFPPRLACWKLQNGFCSKVDHEMSVLSCLYDADSDERETLFSHYLHLRAMFAPCLKWGGNGRKDTEFSREQTQGSYLPAPEV